MAPGATYFKQPDVSVTKPYLTPLPDQRGESSGFAIQTDYNKASEFVDSAIETFQSLGGMIPMTRILSGGTYLWGAGSVSTPAMANAIDSDTGAYWPAAGQFAISIDGTQRGLWTSTGLSITGTVSLTVPLVLTSGGTNASLVASLGGIFYSTATAGAILSGTATARQMLQSGASAAPAWSTTTWPATTTINRLLWSSAANVISDLATANSGILITSSGGVPSIGTDIPTAVTIGGAAIYRVGGTDVAITDGGTGQSTATLGFNALSPLTTLGDTMYHDGTNNVRLAGQITTTRKFLRQTGSGAVSAAPVWDTLLAADIVAQATGGQNVTNNVTDDGSTDGTIPDFTNGTIYATDYQSLRRAIYQLARMLKQDHDQLRAAGFLT